MLVSLLRILFRSLSFLSEVYWNTAPQPFILLTVEQATDIERVQKTCLKVILGDSYVSYSAALEMCGLQTLHDRREARCLDFAVKCVKHPLNKRIFPFNSNLGKEENTIRNRELFEVNFARTEQYRKSAIPFCQRKLNSYFQSK